MGQPLSKRGWMVTPHENRYLLFDGRVLARATNSHTDDVTRVVVMHPADGVTLTVGRSDMGIPFPLLGGPSVKLTSVNAPCCEVFPRHSKPAA